MHRTRGFLVVTVLLTTVAALALSGCSQRSAMFLHGSSEPTGTTSCESNRESARDRPLKVANYNIKSGLWSSLDEVGDVLEGIDADIIALEEVDNGMGRTGHVDQSAVLAERLRAERVFAGSWEKDGGTYGVALLSRVPIVGAERFWLPDTGMEPRAAIDATVCDGASPLRIVAAHSDFLPWAAAVHAEALADRVSDDDGALVMGDLNTSPTSEAIGSFFKRGMKDVLTQFKDGPTFGGSVRLDYILTGRDVDDAQIIESTASDHFPIAALLR
jgi:endonuclease/exonuclease/phosphatase family metal-dependent hydrolase